MLVSGDIRSYSVTGIGSAHPSGESIDDAAGEAFDKLPKLLGLDLSRGPDVVENGVAGDAGRLSFRAR